ncbi:T9SS type A sorting domain-containing protein [Wenyingzhuangia fucanilytica]|uniref:T9SS type A sorting domain-containing protein n=1 Tax=Wenyingzhuangia fucanilytica TaxID=1790137 RepID=UPI0009F3CE5E
MHSNSFSILKLSNANISVYNLYGKKISDDRIDKERKFTSIKYDPGVYIISIHKENNHFTKKIVLN